MPTREERLLHYVDRNGLGLEIGPSHSPIAPKKDGYQVHIIDCADRQQLIEKYRDHGVNCDNIEEVDFVWNGKPYSELTGKHNFYDWIIASHVIEHTTDLVRFLNDCDDILKNDGILSLAVPDKRYCFDHFRPLTGLSRIIDCHLNHSRCHTPGVLAEYFLNVVNRNGQLAWNSDLDAPFRFMHTADDARSFMDHARNHSDYVDCHAWCFTPHSFRLMIHDLHRLGLISLQEIAFFPTDGFEFFVTLGRNGTGPQLSRMEMLHKVEAELAEVGRPKRQPARFTGLLGRVKNRMRRLFARSRKAA